jgi:transcription antitermination protein NusB
MASRRRLARIAVMQTLFEEDFHASHPSEILNQHPDDVLRRNMRESVEPVDEGFAHELLAGVVSHLEDIRKAMQQHAPQWPLARMDRITRSILVMGTYELLFAGDAPPAVVMNEAIDIAKEFGGEESGKFVNGVLNAIAHQE